MSAARGAALIYIILGTHKSGTSLVSELLHYAGIPMVERAQEADYDAGNKWERVATSDLNKGLLDGDDVNSLDLVPPPPGRLENEEALGAARGIVASQRRDAWGFKDPRTCLTWPLWSAVAPEARIVGVYRHFRPVVARHLRKAPPQHRRSPVWPLRVAPLAVRRWCEQNRIVLDVMRSSRGRSILVSYEHLMDGPEELERLGHFLGRPVPDRRRTRVDGSSQATNALAAYAAHIVRWSGRENPPSILRQLEDLRASEIADEV